jgi:uncharacterized protein DUF1549/uncharacterized protein DUF1553/cytochrome c
MRNVTRNWRPLLTALGVLAPWGVAVTAAAAKRPAPRAGASQAAPAPVDYNRDVRPILAEHCFACHGMDADRRQAGLRLDTAEGAFRGGSSGRPAAAPGRPEASELVRRVTGTDGRVMPPPQTGKQLTAEQVRVLRQWIAQGAAYAPHWAYLPPRRPPLPAVKQRGWVRNPIDRFVLARLEREGLRPSPEADRARLIRRVSLDLTGLPPSPAEVEAFLADRSPDAYEKLVDRLLASPHFGERWARPWLDLARYADSHGFQRDDLRDLWPYRDWVINALNQDMPFDQFTIQQLAGDLLVEEMGKWGNGETEQGNGEMGKRGNGKTDISSFPHFPISSLIATGFHRSAPTNVEAGSEPEETRVNQVIDRVNTTATVWLGTTLECAQCHDHKYDPFTQRDYYQLFAFFNSTALEAARSDPKVPGSIRFLGPSLALPDPDREAQRQQAASEIERLDRQLEARRQELTPDLGQWEASLAGSIAGEQTPADIAAILKTPAGTRTAAETRRLLEFRLEQDTAGARLKQQRAALAEAQKELRAPSTLVMTELPQPRTTAIFQRGDYRQPGEPVRPGTPAALHPMPAGPPNRLTLARWLVSRDNPLTARVTVNRWWAELFGRGIVSTVEDFGARGEPPTHPELLDWLACYFVEGNGEMGKRGNEATISSFPHFPISSHKPWSMKHVLRLIVTSATYRQSSSVSNPQSAIRNPQSKDPENVLLARGPRFRLDAETIRDNALAAAGLLSRKQFGPPVRPYQPEGLWVKVGGDRVEYVVSPGEDRYRRGIYTVWKRGSPYPSFLNFDATARLACTVKRSRSNTALQALTLLNDPVYVEAAMALAKRVLTERPEATIEERIRHAFRVCLARLPGEAETGVLKRLYMDELASYREDEKAALELVGPFPRPEGCAPAEFAAWYAVAAALLNLDEMITKG